MNRPQLLHTRLRRTRWTSFGAAIALVVGAGGVLTSSAAGPGTASSFVPITPCRLADTRPAPDNVGTRIAPIAAGESFVAQVTGTNGNCTIPTTATGVSMNITAIAPTAASFLTVWPTDQTRPLTANLNWSAGQAPTPNAVTATLSATGSISLYNLSGTVEVTIDIVGYYQPATGGPAGPAGPRGARQTIQQVLTVAAVGGDYTSVGAAVAAASDASAAKPYLIRIAPGTYTETATINLGGWIDLEGAGQTLTVLRCACNDDAELGPTSGVIRITGSHRPTSLRLLSIRNTTTGGQVSAIGVDVSGDATARLDQLLVVANAGPDGFSGGIVVQQAEADIRDVLVFVGFEADTPQAFGILSVDGLLHLDGAQVVAAAQNTGGSTFAVGVGASGGTATIVDTTALAEALGSVGHAAGLSFTSGAIADVRGGDVTVLGTTTAKGISGDSAATVTIDSVDIVAGISVIPAAASSGISSQGGATVSARNSTITALTASVVSNGGTVRVADSVISGPSNGPVTCTNTFTPALADATCP